MCLVPKWVGWDSSEAFSWLEWDKSISPRHLYSTWLYLSLLRKSWDLLEKKSLRQGCSGNMQGSSLSASNPLLTESSGYTHQMQFEKERGNNHYSVVGILNGFDLEKSLDQEDNKLLYKPWNTLRTFMSVWRCIMKQAQRSTAWLRRIAIVMKNKWKWVWG